MSYPEKNPDTRALPEGWITQYDPTYQTWFYIDTRQNPPRSSWEHPLGPPPPVNYAPPTGPPPSKSPYNAPPSYAQGWQDNRNSSPYGQPSPYQQPQQPYYPQQQQTPHGGSSPAPTSKEKGGLFGKLLGGHGSHGSSHGGHSGGYGGGYAQQPNVVYAKGKPKRHGMGAGGGMALGAGAGLVGGLLIADAIDDFGDASYEQGFDAGGDYGGGDFDF